MNDFFNEIDKMFPYGPNLVLDIGSRDLEHSLKFGAKYPEARIIAFEPNPFGIQQCRHRLGVMGHNNIELHDIALSDQEGEMDFYSVAVNDGCSSLLEPIDVPYGLKQWATVKVKVQRLDTFLIDQGIETVDVLWLDTQGTELKVLEGMGDLLDKVKCIHTEASPRPYYKGHILKNELESFLHTKGFTTTFYPAQGHPYGEGDLICVRNEDNKPSWKPNWT